MQHHICKSRTGSSEEPVRFVLRAFQVCSPFASPWRELQSSHNNSSGDTPRSEDGQPFPLDKPPVSYEATGVGDDGQVSIANRRIRIVELALLLLAIDDRNYPVFQRLEIDCITQHGIEYWSDFFHNRLLPSLDGASQMWLLQEAQLGWAGYPPHLRMRERCDRETSKQI